MLSEAERGADQDLTVSPDEDISILDMLLIVGRHRRLIIKTAVSVALLGVIVSLLLPSRYVAVTTILPPQQGSSASAALMSQLGSLGSVASMAGAGLGLKNPNDLQVALLKSRTVEDALVDRYHLMSLYHAKHRSEARKGLESEVDISNGAKDGLIHIEVTDRSPQRAADLANGYVEEFRSFSSTLAVSEASRRRLFFEQQLTEAKDNLAKAEEDLKRTEQETGLVQLDNQTRATIELVADLRAQVAAKEIQISSLRSFATVENPQLQMAEQDLAGLRAQLQKMGAPSEGASNALIPRGNMEETGLEYTRKLRDVKYYQTIFDMLARQYEAAKVDEARQGALIQTVDRAIVPDVRSSPKRTLIVLGCGMLGAIMGVLWAFSKEGMNRLGSNEAEYARIDELKRLLLPWKK